MRKTTATTVAATAILALVLVGAPAPVRAEVPTDPPTFTDPLDLDNAYHPFLPNRIRLYEQVQGGGDLHVIDVFRAGTRTFTLADGTEVETRILEEWEVEDGEIVEISQNYFAQADDGTVYYFGEVVDQYEGGVVTGHGGSWLVGGPSGSDPAETVTATEPTVFMPGDPEVGDTWKAEDLPDAGIEEFDEALPFVPKLKVPAGTFHGLLKVREETPDVEYKWYAPDVGFLKQKEGPDTVELVALIDSDDEAEMEEALEDLLDDLLSD
jgi:hypothetical protein